MMALTKVLRSKKQLLLPVVFLAAISLVACSSDTSEKTDTKADKTKDSKEITLYSSRDYEIDQKIYKDFENKTGIKVTVKEMDNEELVTLVKAEKDRPVVDAILVNGAQYINELSEAKAIEKINSKMLSENVDEQFYGDKYFGITYRARAIAYDKNKVDSSKIKTYSSLTENDFSKQILVRSSTNSYNQALVMNMIQNEDKEYAKNWADGIVKNMAREPEGGDRDQIKAIYAGLGTVAITNSYYYVQMLNSTDPEEKKAAESVSLKFPEDTHINITWLGITEKGKKNSNLSKLGKYLTSKKVQELYAEKNGEFPVNSEAKTPKELDEYNNFSKQKIDFDKLGKEKDSAIEIFNEVGWK